MSDQKVIDEQRVLRTFYTDRSRIEAGDHCMRRLFLEYYSGDHGYGQRLKSGRLELHTGTLLHSLMEALFACNTVQTMNAHAGAHFWTPEASAEFSTKIEPVVKAWKTEVKASGLQNKAGDQNLHIGELDYTIEEQAWLAQCLAWAFAIYRLPSLLDQYQIIEYEKEREFHLGQVCLTPPPLDDDDFMDIVLQTRPDLVLRRRLDKALVIADFKSTAQASKPWREQWEISMQFAYGAEAVSAHLGEPVLWQLVIGFVKGKREGSWDAEQGKATGPDRQNSPLCYTWYKAPAPPFNDAEFQPEYYFMDAAGKRRTVKGKGFEKVPLWMLDRFTPQSWVQFLMEKFTDTLTGLIPEIGPLLIPDVLRESFKTQLLSRQVRVVDGLERLYLAREAEAKGPGTEVNPTWDMPPVSPSTVLDSAFPQSWACYKWNRWCQFWSACKNPGVPLAEIGEFVQRKPHHAGELLQIKLRGLEIAADAQGDSEED